MGITHLGEGPVSPHKQSQCTLYALKHIFSNTIFDFSKVYFELMFNQFYFCNIICDYLVMVFILLCAAPYLMVLGRVFAKWRAVLFCTKSYYPLVGGTFPIPLNKLIAWLRNSYESLYFAVGIFFRNEKRREPISLKPTDSLLELQWYYVF